MKYQLSFGRVTATAGQGATSTADTGRFRIALLGDFSGRANGGRIETGAALARRRPLVVDVDNLDDVISRLGITLQLNVGPESGTVEVRIESMDDFHPDNLYDRVDIFHELANLRKRLNDSSTFAAAAEEVRAWGIQGVNAEPSVRQREQAKGSTIPTGQLSDFARLLGREHVIAERPAAIDDLVRQIVAPHILPAADPQREVYVAAVDDALSAAMRSVSHHPDFQTVESLWRSVDFLVRELETDTDLQIVLYDITAEEIAADLSATDALEESGLYQLLVEQPRLDEQQGPLSVLLGNYIFERVPAHAELLGRMAQVAAAAQAPFVAGIHPQCLEPAESELHPLVAKSWEILRAMPQANYLGLTVPRFLLRVPYGAKSDPIAAFPFEEFTLQSGIGSMLWGNGAVIVGLLLGTMYRHDGLSRMRLGSLMSASEMPYHCYTDGDGESIALPCTERLISESVAVRAEQQNVMPLLSVKGRPEIRLGSFTAVGGAGLAGPWAPLAIDELAVPI
ncbi:MAG: type VI secretion system contractile sheath large subunit [Planctomycetales bacterium]|nr:type VI secretion system contractile sheath large subunit [Planctomycetales bacterium]